MNQTSQHHAPRRAVVEGLELITVTRPAAQKTVVMIHGYGASFEDLAPLESYLDPERKFNWIFPNGTVNVPLGPHTTGKAWFPIRMADIEAAAMRGEVVDMADALPEGMKSSEQKIVALLTSMSLKPRDLILGGFSQGAMMAIQVALQLPEPLLGLLLFSGTLINQKEWREKLPRLAGVPFFQSHGKLDSILGFAHASRLDRLLAEAGLKGELMHFDGYHEIPLPIIRRAAQFLSAL